MSEDMGATILGQLQQLNINSGVSSTVPNADQHYSAVPSGSFSVPDVGHQNISSISSVCITSMGQPNMSTIPCVSAYSMAQQNIFTIHIPNIFTVPSVGSITSVGQQHISSTPRLGLISVGTTPYNVYSMPSVNISA